MTAPVTVVDFGAGNMFSVQRAFAHLGVEVLLADSPAQIESAARLVLPGVGAFTGCMNELKARKLDAPMRAYAASGRPLLGICVGMQMLFDSSDEFGASPGLGLIAGAVRAIPVKGPTGEHKVPHVGWSGLYPAGEQWTDGLLGGVEPGDQVYFVHSFTAHPVNEEVRLADSDYDGCRISAAVRAGNILGCQFHPEKSGETGLRILSNFASLL